MSTIGIVFLIYLIGCVFIKNRDVLKLRVEIEKGDYILIFIMLALLIFLIIFVDKELAYKISNKYPQGLLNNYPMLKEKLTKIFKLITRLGEPDYMALGVAPFFVYAKFKRNRNLEILILRIIAVIIFSSLISSILKVIFMRSRPYQGWNNLGFYFIIDILKNKIPFSGKYMSFPSGHTLTSSSVYFFLALLNKNNIIKIVCISLALLVGISRIYLSAHWMSDVVISLMIGEFLSRKYRENF